MMWPFSYFFGGKKNISRKYIDLIYNKSSMWATFKPTTTNCVQVGDYGEINPDTGEFEYRGNIYQNESIIRLMPELNDEAYRPKVTATFQHYEVLAKTIREGDVNGGPRLNTALANSELNFEFKFGEGKTGAVLIMLKPEFKEIPRDVLVNRKLGRAPEFKERKYRLVSRVASCPAFVLHISDSRSSCVRLSLNATAPLVPAVAPGAGVGFGWTMGSSGGTTLVGDEQAGSMYHPLFELKRRRENVFRQLAKPGEIVDWLDMAAPWGTLDENGNEAVTNGAEAGGKYLLPDL